MVTFAYCYFQYNKGESQIYLSEIFMSTFSTVSCLYFNNDDFYGISNACFNLRSTLVRFFDSLVIDHCKGLNSAGLKLFDNSTIMGEMSLELNFTAFVRKKIILKFLIVFLLHKMNFTNCNFTNNYVSFIDNGDTEIGTAIYVSSANYMNLTSCLFQV